jgi:hypothetical protein
MNVDEIQVAAVLLADGWHSVHEHTFRVDPAPFSLKMSDPDKASYEFPMSVVIWREPDGSSVLAPVTSVLALRTPPVR